MIDKCENIRNMNHYLVFKLSINIYRYWQDELLRLCFSNFYEDVSDVDRKQVINCFCDNRSTTESRFLSRSQVLFKSWRLTFGGSDEWSELRRLNLKGRVVDEIVNIHQVR